MLEAGGIPLSVILTGGNRSDITYRALTAGLQLRSVVQLAAYQEVGHRRPSA